MGGGWRGAGAVGGCDEKPPTHNRAFSIGDGKVDDNMTIVL